ncbi:ATP-grasp domain-containing protein [Streptomyces sp. NBC_00091]|uniref:ATP-grasp domain-containing protein n=1 Tax=Streptomyces sp. NBC_00091 TaxID=2975648 RepID=UPI00225BE0BF|nr:ATP-grasp domain-containing protein [Streptomyces sp. NBC_00091]MCX5380400.1 ATP-grasp domain-containing protein [Streptomyces sp. NBC_00091]
MTGRGVLLLDAGGPESGALARAAAARGHPVHAATATAAAYAGYGPELKALLAGRVVTDFARPDRALAEIVAYARRYDIGAVLTVNEYLTELTALVCAELGVPGNDPGRARAARDKAAMAEAFAAYGVRTPYTVLVRDDAGLRAAPEDPRIGFPYVVKPVSGAGSAGVTVVTGPAGAATAADAARAVTGMYGSGFPGILVQAYAAGTEYSVESVTQGGTTTHLAVTRKRVTGGPRRVETGHSLPIHLPPAVEAAAYREVEAAIAAAGIRHGASHTEVIVGADGRCTVIEIAARLAAGQIGVLIQHALGIDVWTALLDTALGRPAELTPTAGGYATVRFLTSPRTGRLTSVSGLPKPQPGVPFVRRRAAIGDTVHEPSTNSHRLGSFVVTGSDAAEVEERADALLRRVRIGVQPLPGPAQARPASTSAIAP